MSYSGTWSRQETTPRLPWWRRAAGVTVLVVVGANVVLYALAVWNPWRLVILMDRFSNPWLGLSVTAIGGYLAVWLLLPIRAEARERWRIPLRVTIALVGVVALMLWGLIGKIYSYQASVLDRTDDGDRAVVLLTTGGHDEQELVVWEGSGLFARELTSLGTPCGGLQAGFAGSDVVVVDQGYGDWEFHLDPRTGQAQQVFGWPCPTGPVPANMVP